MSKSNLSQLGDAAPESAAREEAERSARFEALAEEILSRLTALEGRIAAKNGDLERLSRRIEALEQWRGQMAGSVVTGALEARSVTVTAPDGTARIFLSAGDDWASVSVMAEDDDDAPALLLTAMLGDGADKPIPEATVTARNAGTDLAWLGYIGHDSTETGTLMLWGADGEVVAGLPPVIIEPREQVSEGTGVQP